MTDPGLSARLRQRSRRAGLMVGISMALSIAICVGVFAAIYAGLTPWLNDLVPIAPAATQVASNNVPAAPANDPNTTNQPAVVPADQPEPTPTPEPEQSQEPTPPPAEDAFAPTHQIAPGDSINLRPEPSTNNSPIRALSPATPLQFMNENSPSDDGTWMLFVTAEGEEGWVRDIDTEPYEP